MLFGGEFRKLLKPVVLALASFGAMPANAKDLSAGFVVNGMPAESRYPFISGIVEGLAYSRFVSDGKNEQLGMRCIYEWFYDEEGTVQKIYAAFEKFPDHLPGAVMGALVQRRCGP